MPNKLEILLAQINTIIRQQTAPNSITPDSVSDMLDAVANYATGITPFPLQATEEGFLQNDVLAGMDIGCIIGNGAILDAEHQFVKVTENNFVSTVGDPDVKYEFTAGYPYTIIPIL